MHSKRRWIPLAAALCAGLLAIPPAARAQNAANDYVPPKLIKRGSASAMPSGSGTVIVKVFVKKSGIASVQGILKSSNHDLDEAALSIAKDSTYRPATKGGQKVDAFYDFTLRFSAGSASSGGASGTSGIGPYVAMEKANNFTGAKAGLESYLTAHPGDPDAESALGVADMFLNDSAAATAAFDKAGDKIPANFRMLAAQAYAKYAVDQANAKNFDVAIAAAKHSVNIDPSFANYNALGFTQFAAAAYSEAIVLLEKARALGESSHEPNDKRASVDVNLVSAYLQAGNPDAAKPVAAEAKQLNPNNAGAQNAFQSYYDKQASAKLSLGKFDEAAAIDEQGAANVPSAAAVFYTQAALAYLRIKPNPDSAKGLADAQKALALDATIPAANYAAGIALANQGKKPDALVYLNKADAGAKAAGDANLTAAIENAIKQMNGVK